MRDEVDARIWGEHGDEFSASIDRLVKKAYQVFCKMAAIQFSAPWRKRAGEC